jgi:glycosyltransferase involved in cell wall biosynthesis
MTNKNSKDQADICLILEGTYPYVSGGVSGWAHELIKSQDHMTFHLVCLLPNKKIPAHKYQLPKNVIGITNIVIQEFDDGVSEIPENVSKKLFDELEHSLQRLQTNPDYDSFRKLIKTIRNSNYKIGRKLLMNSPEAWNMLVRMHLASSPKTSFIDYFWSWRSLFGGMFSTILSELPNAAVYHALCTGYSGLYLARAHIETGRPCLLTEHGIYTNERRIEIASADWLKDLPFAGFHLEKGHNDRDLRDFWVDVFSSYSKICYDACEKIITLYKGNQDFQIADGADPTKSYIIPNGVDVDAFSALNKDQDHPPTIALIGRVVPIKDIKTFLYTCSELKKSIPNLKAYVMGPMDEDRDYYDECMTVVKHENLDKTVDFTGKVNIKEYLPSVDVLVLTSISEAQPLVILEAGAAGIPTVATDVGSCGEIIYGTEDEKPNLGEGGVIVPLASPGDTAVSLKKLLTDKSFYKKCSDTIKQRVKKYYHKDDQNQAYKEIYGDLVIKSAKKRRVA